MSRGLKYTEATDAGPLDGLERIGIAKIVAGSPASRSTSLQQIANLAMKITGHGGSVEIGPDGSIDLIPAPGTPDGTTGIYASTPDLGAPGTNRMPLLWMHAGANQAGAAIRASVGGGARAAIEVMVNNYSTTVPRLIVDGSGVLSTQTNVVISKSQDTISGEIRRGTNHPSRLDIWAEMDHGITLRAGPLPPDASTCFALKSAGAPNVTDSGDWIFAINNAGTLRWGSVTWDLDPTGLNTATLGIDATSGRLTASHLDTPPGGDVRIGTADLGGALNVFRFTPGPIACFGSNAVAAGGSLFQATHQPVTGSVSGFVVVLNSTDAGLAFVGDQMGTGSCEIRLRNVSGTNTLHSFRAGAFDYSFGVRSSDGKFLIAHGLTFDNPVFEITPEGRIGFTPTPVDGAYYTMGGADSQRIYWRHLPNTTLAGMTFAKPFNILGEIALASPGNDSNFVYTMGHAVEPAGVNSSGLGGYRDIWESRNWNGSQYQAKRHIVATRGATFQADGKGAYFAAYSTVYNQTTDNVSTEQTADSFNWRLIKTDRSTRIAATLAQYPGQSNFDLTDTLLAVSMATPALNAITAIQPDGGGLFLRLRRIANDIVTINGVGQFNANLASTGTAGGSVEDFYFRGRSITSGVNFQIDDQYGPRMLMFRGTANNPTARLTSLYGTWRFNEAVETLGSVIIGTGGSIVVRTGAAIVFEPGSVLNVQAGVTCNFYSPIYAIGGATVGLGATPPTGARLRIDQTDVLNGRAAIEFFNGNSFSFAYMEASGAGERFGIQNANAVRFESTAGVYYASFRADHTFALANGKFMGDIVNRVHALAGLTVGPGSAPYVWLSNGLRVNVSEGTGTTAEAMMLFHNDTTAAFVGLESPAGGGKYLISSPNGAYLKAGSNILAVFNPDKSIALGNGTINSYGQHNWNANGAGTGGIAATDFLWQMNAATTGTGVSIADSAGFRLIMNRASGPTIAQRISGMYGLWQVYDAMTIQNGAGLTVLLGGTLTIASGGIVNFNAGSSVNFNSVLYAKAGATVGLGTAAPSTGSRLRIDQTDALNSHAVIELFNGTVGSLFYLEAVASGGRISINNDAGFVVRTTVGGAYFTVGNGGTIIAGSGAFQVDLNGITRVYGIVVGSQSSPAVIGHLRVDRTHGPTGPAVAEWYNGAVYGVMMLASQANGSTLDVACNQSIRFGNLTMGVVYAQFNPDLSWSMANGKISGTPAGTVKMSGGLTVGRGATDPTVTGRLRIDQTDAVPGPAVVEYYNGTATGFTYLTAGNRFLIDAPAGTSLYNGGTLLAQFNGDLSWTMNAGKFTATAAGIVKASGGMTIGTGTANPSAGSRLRIDQTDGANGYAIIEMFNGSQLNAIATTPVADGGNLQLMFNGVLRLSNVANSTWYHIFTPTQVMIGASDLGAMLNINKTTAGPAIGIQHTGLTDNQTMIGGSNYTALATMFGISLSCAGGASVRYIAFYGIQAGAGTCELYLQNNGAGHSFGRYQTAGGTWSAGAHNNGNFQICSTSTLGASVRLEITPAGAVTFATLTNAAAANNSTYFSSDNGKLVYKDAGGVVNNLY